MAYDLYAKNRVTTPRRQMIRKKVPEPRSSVFNDKISRKKKKVSGLLVSWLSKTFFTDRNRDNVENSSSVRPLSVMADKSNCCSHCTEISMPIEACGSCLKHFPGC
jgi:hypothetical protein